MGCSLFSNSHLQMGVTVMGFAKHFGHCHVGQLRFEKADRFVFFHKLDFLTFLAPPPPCTPGRTACNGTANGICIVTTGVSQSQSRCACIRGRAGPSCGSKIFKEHQKNLENLSIHCKYLQPIYSHWLCYISNCNLVVIISQWQYI